MFHFDPKKEFSYVGEFWYSDTPNDRFSGVLNYTIEKGLQLKILTPADLKSMGQREIQDKTIHGFVEKIEEVTLLNCLSNGGGSINLRSGKPSYSVKEYSVFYAVIGKHCEKQDKVFTGITFHFPEIDSFCRIYDDSYFVNDKKPIIKCKLSNSQSILIRQGRRDVIDLNFVLPEDMRIKLIPLLKRYNKIVQNKIISKKSKMTKRDEAIVKRVDREKEKLNITKPFFCINITDRKNTLGDYIQKRFEVLKMFSLFSLSPVYCDFVELKEGKKTYILIENIGKQEKASRLMMPHKPITIHNIKTNFSSIFNKWNCLPSELLNMLFVDKLYHKASAGYQQYSIIVAILGSWQVQNGLNKDYKSRYENILNENLLPSDPINDEIVNRLQNIFGLGRPLKDIAIDLGGLRDCILHMDSITKTQKKYKKYQPILENEIHINNLCEILFLFTVKIVYDYLGITLLDEQKQNLSRQIVSWSSYSL